MEPFRKAKHLSQSALDSRQSKWVRLTNNVNQKGANNWRRITYEDAGGQERSWESAERTTRPDSSTVDGVGIVTIMRGMGGPHILLQKQYRPPIDKVCIEVPAGLLDPGESPIECAIRELKEETGYVGTFRNDGWGAGPLMYNDPGFCNTNLYMVHIDVDMSRAENKDPKPELEENEFIECFTVSLRNLPQECMDLEADGYAIDARVATLAEGIKLAKQWEL